MRSILVLALLLGADGPDAPAATADDEAPPDPASDGPVDLLAPDAETPADTSNRAAAEPAVTTWGPDDALDAPEIRLRRAIELLAAGAWYDALEISVRSITDYPGYADSFEAVARIATDQLRRDRGDIPPISGVPPRPNSPPVATTGTWRPPTTSPYGPGGTWRPPTWQERPHPGADDPRSGLLVGFDVGLNTGARVEWKAKGRTVDGVGFQASLGTVIYGGLYIMPITQVYLDFASRSDWQFETSLGMFWSGGTPYPLIGVAAQWDPPRPIQVTAGLDIGAGVFPDVSVGFLW